ncbi:MAG TPA: hypothetical protein VGP76_22465 [Planctomycetaceae bacterium]|jgi:predicted Abi (CAAX) family protease|nr:hypothetical protein [Planctomycetaceae bacterium]
MQTLRPLAIAFFGTLLLGVVLPLIAFLTSSEFPDAGAMLRWFTIGAATGLVFFAPIAVAEAIRSRSNRQHYSTFFRIHWSASLGMALAMGYLAASYVHGTFDPIVFLALLVVFIGAMTKVCVGIILKPEDDKRWWV